MAVVSTPIHQRHAPRRLQLAVLGIMLILAATYANYAWNEHTNPSGPIRGSGIPAEQARNVASFTAVDLAGANTVTVHAGEDQSVVVRADDNLIERITTEVHDQTLQIDNVGTLTTNSSMAVEITVPSLDSVVLSGSGGVAIVGVDAVEFSVRLTGSGVINASGTADRLKAIVEGTGDGQLLNLVAHEVTASVSGTGRLEVHTTESLDAYLSGIGAIDYIGNPTMVTKHITGTGTITNQ